MSLSVMEAFRENNGFLKSVAATTLFFFSFSFYSPTVFAVKDGVEKQKQIERVKQLDPTLDPMSQQMKLLTQQVSEKKDIVGNKLKENDGVLDHITRFLGLEETVSIAILQESLVEFEKQHNKTLEDFDKTRQYIQAKNLSPVIMQRHEAALAKINQELDQLKVNFALLESSQDLEQQQVVLSEIENQLSKHKLKRTFTPTDPDSLPWGAPDASKTRKPAKTPEELSRLTGISPFPQGTQLASNVITPDMLGQPGGPVAEDLAATIDAKLTDSIQAKAEELEFDPVKIYNWVRNTIEFIPSYGSIQGAEYTMQHGKGNAFDTASLLIALLRASNIPARYAYGTVDIPAEKAMNWVGGVDVPGAAQQLLGQGGIPNVAIVEGGQIRSIEMEHVWVEAWIDYLPSRGAKHEVGDHWIPMDASFKQYDHSAAMEIQGNIAFDPQALIEQSLQQTTINEAEGWLQNFDISTLSEGMDEYQAQIEAYIDSQVSGASGSDVLGVRQLIIYEPLSLAAGLPYTLVASTDSFSVLPSSLRHKFRYTLGTEYYGSENSRLITLEKSLPELAGKKLGLSFKPATADDEELLATYFPEPDPDTGEVDPSSMPSTLPGYLLNLTAELMLDGETIDEEVAGTLGGELYETMGVWSPGYGWEQSVNHPVAGEYRAIGLDLQGVNSKELADLQVQLEQTKQIIEAGNSDELLGLSAQELVGDYLYSAIYSYLAMNGIQDKLQAEVSGIVTNRMPSYGLFSTSLQTYYFYGTPRDVEFSGLVVDVDRLSSQVVAKDNDGGSRLSFTKVSGARASAMEHIVPEQVLSTELAPAHGISAVRALALANEQGQKIWTITRNNLSEALAAIDVGADIESEISASVNAGKVATVHEQPVSFYGGNNVGYLILDPTTGAGAYKIAGGLNGGFVDADTASIWGFLGFAAGMIGAGLVAASSAGLVSTLLLFFAAAVAIILTLSFVLDYMAIEHRCSGLGGLVALAVGAAIVGLVASGFGAIFLMYLGLLAGAGASTAASSSSCQ